MRIAFTLDCCDREAISWVTTTDGIGGGDIRDLMIESVERRYGLVNPLPPPVDLFGQQGSSINPAGDTCSILTRHGLPRGLRIRQAFFRGAIDPAVRSRVAVQACARPDQDAIFVSMIPR